MHEFISDTDTIAVCNGTVQPYSTHDLIEKKNRKQEKPMSQHPNGSWFFLPFLDFFFNPLYEKRKNGNKQKKIVQKKRIQLEAQDRGV